jgi:hypothetical protein
MGHVRLLALVTLGFLAAITTSAHAAQGITPSGLIQDVGVTQTSTEAGRDTQAVIRTALGTADNSRLSATFNITVQLPAGMVRNTTSFPTCEVSTLESMGPHGCPAGAVIGTGVATADARPVVLDAVNAGVTIVNAPNGGVLLFVFPDLGPILVIEGQAIGSDAVAFDIPPIPTVPGAPIAALEQLTLKFTAPGYLTNPRYCPTTGWTWGFDFTYENGEGLSLSASIACTGSPPPPTGEGNRATACEAERATIGDAAFDEKYGTNRNGSNANGKCVSQSRVL